MAYVKGTKLVLAGNGSGYIWANPDSSYMFSDSGSDKFSNLITIDGAELLNTIRAQTFYRMFYICTALTTVDVSMWDTRNVENMNGVFNQAKALLEADVSDWNMSKVTTVASMFQVAMSLTKLDLSKWDVSNVEDMSNLFRAGSPFGMMNLVSVGNICNWNTSKVTNLAAFCNACAYLEELNVTNWDVSSVSTMQNAFGDCRALRELNLSKWNTQSLTADGDAFRNMYRLEKVTVGENCNFLTATLPTPSADYITLADGNWYDSELNVYAPANVPHNTARTYYASKLVAVGDDAEMVLVKNGTLKKIAFAIRYKNGGSKAMYPGEFAEEILELT